jgi:hypothetical protein
MGDQNGSRSEPSQGPEGAPEFQELKPAYDDFVESMRVASWIFETEDAVEGCTIALHAAIRFLGVRHLPYWTVFAGIQGAFRDLERGVDPELFSRSKEVRRRPRSSVARHAQLVAAACMGGLMDEGDSLETAARRVARAAKGWNQFAGMSITHHTIRNWRDAVLNEEDERHLHYLRMIESLKKNIRPRDAIETILKNGPPGSPAPRKSP